MPRKPRMYLPGIPCHVIQRGNNREATFFAEHDYQFYLECLQDAAQRYQVKVHAYVLMTNHVHMLMTPVASESISLTMQSIGRRYVQYINMAYKRSGTLWEGRHKASVVDADNYLLACMRYIELNPVNAKMVIHPAKYRWTSYRCNAQGESCAMISPHEIYSRLGTDSHTRQQAYVALFKHVSNQSDTDMIRTAAHFSMPTGDDHFKRQIEQALDRKVGYAHRGRPRKPGIRE